MPGGARRRVGVYLARQAIGYAALGEPDHAVEPAAESARIAAETGSVRHRRELAVLRRAMGPWASGGRGERLVDALSVVPG
ncbi:hypothetical protein AB0G74_05145 [Streptomyces sp. NPDC020875]|uniref:hypothetical protein n=1 Tax=Streptomyces sp. NPDC020875 TaxID=3154898 RepID=UPI0033C0DDEB